MFEVWEDGECLSVPTLVDAQVGRLPFPPLCGTLWDVSHGILSCHAWVKSDVWVKRAVRWPSV